jgi:hypothetical protein
MRDADIIFALPSQGKPLRAGRDIFKPKTWGG